MSDSEPKAFVEQCFAYDDILRENGHRLTGGEALQSARKARTVRSQDGQLLVTDGPYAETKEQLGGFGLLEAGDLDHTIQLISKHPGLRMGPVEIRPADEEINRDYADRKRKPRVRGS
jgi:hypothetical protein